MQRAGGSVCLRLIETGALQLFKRAQIFHEGFLALLCFLLKFLKYFKGKGLRARSFPVLSQARIEDHAGGLRELKAVLDALQVGGVA